MKTQIIISVLLLFLFHSCGAQSTQKKIDGFKMPIPTDWLDKSDLDIKKNISSFDFDDEEIDQLLENNNNSIPVAIYMKYDQSEYNGPIPTIQVNLRPNHSQNFSEFKSMMTQGVAHMEEFLTNFKLLTPMKETTVDGVKGLMFLAQFELSNGVDTWTIRSWTYAFPSDDYFYQINFSDTKDENSEKIYEEVLKKIKFRA